jgi:predicted Fe-S protein YdhL (DUF1289 family)
MCKNEGNPCPGCKKHKTSDAAWMFFSEDARQALAAMSQTKAPAHAAAHS